jgi:hypothetical protein
MGAKVKCPMCLAGCWKGWLTPNDKPEMVFIVYHFSEMHPPPSLLKNPFFASYSKSSTYIQVPFGDMLPFDLPIRLFVSKLQIIA